MIACASEGVFNSASASRRCRRWFRRLSIDLAKAARRRFRLAYAGSGEVEVDGSRRLGGRLQRLSSSRCAAII